MNCHAIRAKDGLPCYNKAVDGSIYCGIHRPRSVSQLPTQLADNIVQFVDPYTLYLLENTPKYHAIATRTRLQNRINIKRKFMISRSPWAKEHIDIIDQLTNHVLTSDQLDAIDLKLHGITPMIPKSLALALLGYLNEVVEYRQQVAHRVEHQVEKIKLHLEKRCKRP